MMSFGDRATIAIGSLTGMCMNYGWARYFWREAHEYFMDPFGIFLWGTGLVCDLIYPFILYQVRKALPYGRRVREDDGTQSKVGKRS
jgi:hypothetical protein